MRIRKSAAAMLVVAAAMTTVSAVGQKFPKMIGNRNPALPFQPTAYDATDKSSASSSSLGYAFTKISTLGDPRHAAAPL